MFVLLLFSYNSISIEFKVIHFTSLQVRFVYYRLKLVFMMRKFLILIFNLNLAITYDLFIIK